MDGFLYPKQILLWHWYCCCCSISFSSAKHEGGHQWLAHFFCKAVHKFSCGSVCLFFAMTRRKEYHQQSVSAASFVKVLLHCRQAVQFGFAPSDSGTPVSPTYNSHLSRIALCPGPRTSLLLEATRTNTKVVNQFHSCAWVEIHLWETPGRSPAMVQFRASVCDAGTELNHRRDNASACWDGIEKRHPHPRTICLPVTRTPTLATIPLAVFSCSVWRKTRPDNWEIPLHFVLISSVDEPCTTPACRAGPKAYTRGRYSLSSFLMSHFPTPTPIPAGRRGDCISYWHRELR